MISNVALFLCSMLRHVSSWLICFLCISHVCAQSSFDGKQSDVFALSENQWLVNELKTVNPSYFDCAKYSFSKPTVGFFPLYGDSIQLDESRIKRFEALWFPAEDCKRFLAIKAMADLYMPLFKRKAEQLKLHPDAAFLPVALSGCNQSYVQGERAGLWAMAYLPARKQHLRIDTLVDERLGGDFTTDAALKHYEFLLSKQHTDNWRASLAYRYGPSVVSQIDTSLTGKALLELISQEQSDFLRFHAYTLALLRSVHAENQMSNCFDILAHFQPITIDKPLKMEAIAKVLTVDEKNLRAANPVYTGAYLVPGYRRIPFVMEDTLLGRFRMNADSIAHWQPPKPVVVEEEWETYWLQHRVGKGETLGRIAGKYHVTIAQLKKWNKLRSDKIRKGQVLKIEKRKKVVHDAEENEIQNGHEIQNHNENDNVNHNEEHTQSPLPTPQSPLPTPQSSIPNSKSPRYYTVKSGDSLWSIAKKYPGVTEQDLMKWNKCGANIRPGQKLVIR